MANHRQCLTLSQYSIQYASALLKWLIWLLYVVICGRKFLFLYSLISNHRSFPVNISVHAINNSESMAPEQYRQCWNIPSHMAHYTLFLLVCRFAIAWWFLGFVNIYFIVLFTSNTNRWSLILINMKFVYKAY